MDQALQDRLASRKVLTLDGTEVVDGQHSCKRMITDPVQCVSGAAAWQGCAVFEFEDSSGLERKRNGERRGFCLNHLLIDICVVSSYSRNNSTHSAPPSFGLIESPIILRREGLLICAALLRALFATENDHLRVEFNSGKG